MISGISRQGWKNIAGTGSRTCRCLTWKQHWLNYSDKRGPVCSVSAAWIPCLGFMSVTRVSRSIRSYRCAGCNGLDEPFELAGGDAGGANRSVTCG